MRDTLVVPALHSIEHFSVSLIVGGHLKIASFVLETAYAANALTFPGHIEAKRDRSHYEGLPDNSPYIM